MPIYKVAWQTTPAVGSEYYNGRHTVFAADDHEAEEKTKTEKARHLGRKPSEIVVTNVSRGTP